MNNTEKILRLHAQRYPAMEAVDHVKLIYQSEFGPGHLVDAEDNAVLDYLKKELEEARQEGYSPAYQVEAIGSGLCRFHLDPARLSEEDLPLVARCFAWSARERGTRKGLWTKLGRLSALVWKNGLPTIDNEDLGHLLDWYVSEDCPSVSHSEDYHNTYLPHYRIMDRDLALYFPALQAIDAALRSTDGTVIVAVDGRCGSGKSTFAQRVSQIFDDCAVFHMDDYFLPFEKRTPERLAAPGGNVDHERAAAELFGPLSRGESVTVRPFDCSTGTFLEGETVPPCRLAIVEGSYALHPALATYSQVHLFFTCDEDIQLARLAQREDAESLEAFQERWIPLEEAYLDALPILEQADVVIDTTKLPTGQN